MNDMNRYNVINIREYFNNSESSVIGEDMLKTVLSSFSCPNNFDVEHFLKEQAIEFTKKNQSVSYLVFSEDYTELLGYFTLTTKPISININSNSADKFSNTIKRKISRVSEYDELTRTYTLSAYLIAQLGKNYTDGVNQHITGTQLLDLAINQIRDIQFLAGGMVMFLEAENHSKLMQFYKKKKKNGFKQFDIRETTDKEHTYNQLLRII